MDKIKVAKNAVWIIGIQATKSIIGLVIFILTARYLGPSNYGLINYASSIVSFVAPIMYLGLTGILVQEIVNSPEKEGETLGTSIVMSFVSSLFCILGVFGFTKLANAGEDETTIVCVLYSVLLVFQSVDLIQYWFQAKLLSKYSSIVSFIAYLVMTGYRIFLLVTQKSVRWFALSYVIDYFLIAVLLVIVYKKKGTQKLSFSFKRIKELFGKSKYYIIADMMVVIFSQTDRIMLKIMIDDSATGYYSAAVTCAGVTGFVFSAIIDSFRPLIFDCKKTDPAKYEKSVCTLYNIVIYFSLIQSALITIFSTFIIKILYGADYLVAADALKIVVWYTTFSYIGSVRNIWMLAEEKQKYIWVLNLSGAVGNVALNFALIPSMGIMGAALASLITQIFANFIMGFIVAPVRHNNTLMLKSLNPKYFTDILKSLKNRKIKAD